MPDAPVNNVTLHSIHALQLQTATTVGELRGTVLAVDSRLAAIDANLTGVQIEVRRHGQELAQLRQSCADRQDNCSSRMRHQSEELERVSQDAVAAREGSQRIHLQMVRDEGDRGGSRRTLKALAALLGALLAGGGGTLLLQLFTR